MAKRLFIRYNQAIRTADRRENDMKTGALLGALIDAAQIQKTDFALSMNMTPSGLSKILTGKRLPFLKEKEAFSRQAAAYFAEIFFGYGCYLKLGPVFPVVYDFNSKYELEVFLASAIEYALDGDFLAENGESPDYPCKEQSFLGKKTMLNLFCVILSDYVRENRVSSMEFYSALPLFDPVYAEIFGRIRVALKEDPARVSFHHMLDISSFETSYGSGGANLLSCIFNAERHVDLNLWETEKTAQSPFLLLKGQFLLIFTLQIDGKTPLMTLIRHKAYLTMFFNNLMRRNTRKISYNREEALRLLETDSSLSADLIGEHLDAVYNFLPIGYLSDAEKIGRMSGKDSVKKGVAELFCCALEKCDAFFLSVDSLSSFYCTGKVIIPLLGTIEIAKDRRIPFLMRYDTAINKKALHSKVRITGSEVPKMFALCAKGLSLIYLYDDASGAEKIHCFHSDIVQDILSVEVADGSVQFMEFSHELWSSYIGGLSNGQSWI